MNTMGSVETEIARPRLVGLYRALAGLTALLILLQAVFAGRGWFKNQDFIDAHEVTANVVFLVALVQVAIGFALVGSTTRRARFLAPLGLLIVLVVAQIGLGYGGRESAESAAWHIPNGVLLMGLSVYLLMSAPRADVSR